MYRLRSISNLHYNYILINPASRVLISKLKKMLAARKTGIPDTSEKEKFVKQLKALADV